MLSLQFDFDGFCCRTSIKANQINIPDYSHTPNALINATTKSRIKIWEKKKIKQNFVSLLFCVVCAIFVRFLPTVKVQWMLLPWTLSALLIMKLLHCCAITCAINQLKINNCNNNNNNNNNVCHGRRYAVAATPQESDQNEGGASGQLKELVAWL